MERWTNDVAEDLQALAQLAALRRITPMEYECWAATYPGAADALEQRGYAAAGYPSEEDEGEMDEDTLPLFGDPWQPQAVETQAFWQKVMHSLPPVPVEAPQWSVKAWWDAGAPWAELKAQLSRWWQAA